MSHKNPRWPPKTKMAAKSCLRRRLKSCVWSISITIPNIKFVPRPVTTPTLTAWTTGTDYGSGRAPGMRVWPGFVRSR